VDPVTTTVLVNRPREEVFEYLVDIANLWEFTDHFLQEFHLTREDTYGVGAGARFRIDVPFQRFDWADVTITDVEAPRRIVMKGRGGKFNRVRMVWIFTVERGAGGGAEVTWTTETEPKMPSDRFLEALAGRRWHRKRQNRALRRLRSIFEEGRERGRRGTIAGGGARKPASQFRL
jgi:uncharacterized protein YndB with AHSA1/START domain